MMLCLKWTIGKEEGLRISWTIELTSMIAYLIHMLSLRLIEVLLGFVAIVDVLDVLNIRSRDVKIGIRILDDVAANDGVDVSIRRHLTLGDVPI
jgi:hypothetical protein